MFIAGNFGALRSVRKRLGLILCHRGLCPLLGAGEHRDCTVYIGCHRDHVIVAKLDQCVILSIGLPDAADLRRVDNNRLAGRQFGELMELDAHGISP
jgi:hypothetical protein